MKPLRINIILPFLPTRPGGGARIMYEYANRLQERGHQVRVLHSIQRPYRRIKSPVWWKQLVYQLRGLSGPPWFRLSQGIRSMVVPGITNDHVPDADICFATWWEMAYMISGLATSKGKPFHLIQDYEIWKGHEDLVHRSYRLPIQHLVIARYLQELVETYSGNKPKLLPNAIDLDRFQLIQPVASRPPQSIIMLYSEEERKGSKYGLEALIRLQQQVPGLTVDLFGVFEPPSLPRWIRYHQKPDNLPELMNRNAIFFSPSLGEGWALPPAEAMASGCAVVCTDIGGHADYAINGETALLTKPKDVAHMASQLKTLIDNSELRIQIAGNGHTFIRKNFSWAHSVSQLEAWFYDALK